MRLTVFSTLIAAFLIFCANPAFAQNDASAPESSYEDPYEDVPKEYLDEADHFYKYCKQNSKFNQYYDCKCLSVRFLDQRIALGPEATRDGIMHDISKTCPDASEAAGRHYERCVTTSVTIPPGMTPEEYCSCFANTYAKLFEHYSLGASSKTFLKLQTQAYVTCRNPELARRLYPYVPN